MIARLRYWLRGQIWHRSWFIGPIRIVWFRRHYGHWPRLLRPQTFNEKLLLRMILDRRDVLRTITSKLDARAYVSTKLGQDDRQAPLLAVVRRVEEVAALDLPPRYVAKASHASGLVRIVTPDDPISAAELADLVRVWLAEDYGRYGLEWSYRDLERVVVFEALLESPRRLADDVKLYCFNGRAHYAHFNSERFNDPRQTTFDRDWRRLDVRFNNYVFHHEMPPRPARWEEMVAEAERVSAGLDFVRVDLLTTGDAFWVGELTVNPHACRLQFHPASWDATFGALWKLPSLSVLRGWR